MTALLKRMATGAVHLVCFVFLAVAPARAGGDIVAPVASHTKFTGWWELGGFYGTDDSSRGEIVLFTPLAQSASTLFFLDARGKLFEEDVQEANLALGYRQMMPSGWNLGLWAGWDIRDTEEDNTFHQVSFGLEALSERYDLRVNGYVPVTDPKGSPGLAEIVLRGNNILMIGGEEVALYGVDAEVGVLLFGRNHGGGGLKGAPAPAKRHELRAYAGGFWFDADEALEEVAGPKGRLEYRINDVVSSLPGSRLTLESELSYDEVRDTRFEIGARLRIPFGAHSSDAASRNAALTGQELRMIEGLERDTDIITVQSKEENVFDNATNVAMNAVSFANDAAGFADAVNQGGNRLIILQDGGAQIDVSATDGQQLQTNQTVQGGGSILNYRGAKSGTVAAFRAPGSRPTLFTNDVNFNTGAITVANNTHVAGLNVRGVGDRTTFVAGNHGVRGLSNLNNVVIEQMDIRNMGEEGIRFTNNNSNVKIYNSTVSDIGNNGIQFEDNNSDVTIDHVDVSETNANGIRFDEFNSNVRVQNTNVTGVDDRAIFFQGNSSDVWFTNVNVSDTGLSGISISSDNTNIAFSNVDVRNIGSTGILFAADNTNITFSNVDVFNAGTTGINFSNRNTGVSFTNVDIITTGTNGINFNGDNTNISLVNVDVIDTGTTAINFNSDNTVTFSGVNVTQTNSTGINFSSRNAVTFTDVNVSDTDNDGVNFNEDNVVSFQRVTISNIGDGGDDDALVFGANNTVDINNTTFAGTMDDDILSLVGLGNTINGANNPNNAIVGGFVCNLNAAAGAFTGSVTIGNQTFVNGAGCNP